MAAEGANRSIKRCKVAIGVSGCEKFLEETVDLIG